MNPVKQVGWLFAVLVAIACCSGYFANAHPTVKLDEKTLATTADSIIHNLKISQFNEQGILNNFLESREMHHIPENNTSRFFYPHIIIKQEGKANWDIRALSAKSINKAEQITFFNQVRIQQIASPDNPESIFETEKLDYFPNRKFATTKDAVAFTQPGTIVHARGMNAYLDTKHIVLLHNTRATYEPKKN